MRGRTFADRRTLSPSFPVRAFLPALPGSRLRVSVKYPRAPRFRTLMWLCRSGADGRELPNSWNVVVRRVAPVFRLEFEKTHLWEAQEL